MCLFGWILDRILGPDELSQCVWPNTTPEPPRHVTERENELGYYSHARW